MEKITRTFLTFGLILTGFLAFGKGWVLAAAPAASTPQKLRISPAILNLTLKPDTASTQSVTIENLSGAPLPIQASLEGFDAGDEENGIALTAAPPPLASWTSLSQTDMIVPANAKKTVTVTIRVPKTVPVGGYYALLFFSPVRSGPSAAQTVVPKVGALILTSLGVPDTGLTADEKAKIVDFSLTPAVSEGDSLTYLLRVKNTELSHLTVKPILTFRNVILKTEKQVEFPEKIVLPGKIRRWDGDMDNQPFGIYETNLMVSLGGGEHLTRSIYVVVFPWKEVAGATAVSIVVVYLFLKRKNLGRALRTLFRP